MNTRIDMTTHSLIKSATLISHALWDGLLPFLPSLRRPHGYAFLVHPRDINDVYRKYPFARRFKAETVLSFIRTFWPVTVSRIDGADSIITTKPITGYVISIPVTARQMTDDRDLALKHIIRAARLAKKKGAKIIGLGALTASLSKGGLDIKKELDISVTTGRIFTSYIVTETALKAMREVGLSLDNCKIGIVGAAGSIGTACAQIFAARGAVQILLIDISSKHKRVEELHHSLIENHPGISVDSEYDLEHLITCDVIIAATNHPEALIRSRHVKSGAVIVDDAQPSDVADEIFRDRPDVLALEGGVVSAPHINTHFNFGLKHRDDIFSCLAEAIILASIEHFDDFQVGAILTVDDSALRKIEESAKILGFGVGHFQNDHRLYTDKDIAHIRTTIKSRIQ